MLNIVSPLVFTHARYAMVIVKAARTQLALTAQIALLQKSFYRVRRNVS
jgi:hypothetical protein